MNWIIRIMAAVLCMAATACGHDEDFRIHGEISDKSSINLRYVFYIDGNVKSGLTASNDGKFEFSGKAEKPAVVEIYDNEYRLLARLIARNGEDIDLKIDRSNIYKNTMSGNEMSEQLASFLNSNSGDLASDDSDRRNGLIAEYVGKHTGSPVSLLLLTTEFDASTAERATACDSLTGLLDESAFALNFTEPFTRLNSQVASKDTHAPITEIIYKAKGNRKSVFTPDNTFLSVISISDSDHGRDSVLAALRRIAAMDSDRRVAILDLNVDSDTMIWVRLVRTDSVEWRQGWAAGSLAGPALGKLGIPSVPYFVLTDSAGTQLWRGPSPHEAAEKVEQLLRQP